MRPNFAEWSRKFDPRGSTRDLLSDGKTQRRVSIAPENNPPPSPMEGSHQMISTGPGTESNFGLHLLNPSPVGSLSPTDPDIVAIHGINGDKEATWTSKITGKLWLRDFLPRDVPGARVFSFSYDADVMFSRSSGDIDSFSRALLNSLLRVRSGILRDRPLLFVCHSMGGLVFKQVRTDYSLVYLL